MSTRTAAACILILLALHTAGAQPQRMPDEQPGQFVFLDAITYPDTGTARARVDVRYRIDRNFFVAVRTTDPAAEGPFHRSGEILIELFDSTNTSVSRKFERLSLPDTQAERDPGDPTWYEGAASFPVKQGLYHIFFEATDRQSDRRYVHRAPAIVRTIPVVPQKLTLFPIGYITPVADLRTATLVPDNYGEDLLFNAPRQLLLAVALPDDTTRTISVDYHIGVLEHEGHPGPPVASDSARVLPVLTGYGLRVSDDPGTATYTLVEQPKGRIGFVAVPLATAQLPLRTFSLMLHARAGSTEASLTRTVRNVWPSMPRSLRNVDTAIEVLRLITTEQTLDSLGKGDFAERRDALEAFWAKRDPTPGTIFNEAMTEFYRRVDHARATFSTLQEPDGMRSDRGRIYILNGQPTHVERSLNPAQGYTEVWTYEKSKRSFTFVDERRNGTYKLAATQK